MGLDIDGNAALVTASSSGLGKASAAALAQAGANVLINGRDEDRLSAAADDLADLGDSRVVAQKGDLTVKEDVEALVERTVDEFGGIDHVVTSAGGPPSGTFLETTDEDWYESYDLLVMSVVRLVREAAEYLQADGGGTIVAITSRSVKEAIPSLVLSNSVRMAVIGLEKTLSMELAPDVRANAVLPGPHETERIRNLVKQGVERGEYESYESGIGERGAGNPLEKIGDPKNFGRLVAFLSSPQAGHINGVAIPVDGGSGASNI